MACARSLLASILRRSARWTRSLRASARVSGSVSRRTFARASSRDMSAILVGLTRWFRDYKLNMCQESKGALMEREFHELKVRTAQLLTELGVHDVEPDGDGDWTVVIKGWRVLIRPTEEPMFHLFIWSGVARYADPSCLAELNDLNLATGWCRFVRTSDGAVYVAAHLPAYSLTKRALLETLGAVAAGAAIASPMIEAVYGGGRAA